MLWIHSKAFLVKKESGPSCLNPDRTQMEKPVSDDPALEDRKFFY